LVHIGDYEGILKTLGFSAKLALPPRRWNTRPPLNYLFPTLRNFAYNTLETEFHRHGATEIARLQVADPQSIADVRWLVGVQPKSTRTKRKVVKRKLSRVRDLGIKAIQNANPGIRGHMGLRLFFTDVSRTYLCAGTQPPRGED
jgi:hypothetical protein